MKKPLVWTARKPRKEGWYWVRNETGLISVAWMIPGHMCWYKAYAGPLVPPVWR